MKMSRAQVLRRRLTAIAIVAVLALAAYLVFIRNSSLVAVDEVKVEGVTANRDQIAAVLTRKAEDMTTLHLREEELRAAVSRYPTVASLDAHPDFPHGLRIVVHERLPVAVAKVDGEGVPVSADGYVLAGLEFDPKQLPSIDAGSAQDGRLDEDGAAQAAILGDAPEVFRDRLRSASWDPDRGGVVVDLDGAPELRFGDGEGAEEKWTALAAVLADPELGSPGYVDVSVPERPVASS
jgi:cell division protein FtsQ